MVTNIAILPVSFWKNWSCPLGLASSQGESLSAYCWNCGACIDSCEHVALRFTWREELEGYDSTDAPLASSRH